MGPMDSFHHCIRFGSGSPRAEPEDDGTMSSRLYLAVCGGRSEDVIPLLPADQVAGLISTEGNNALHLVAQQGHDKLIEELYDRSGDTSLLSSQNSTLDTPLHCAARAGHENAVSVLVRLARDNRDESILGFKNKAGDTALHLAARLGHAAAVKAMVSEPSDLASEVNNAGVSPLYLGVMSGSEPTVRAITESCSHASAAGPNSQNALHAAVFQGKRMVKLLLGWKPGPSLASDRDVSGSTPLHFASSDGDHSVVDDILLAVPPSVVRTRDERGLSALHVAAEMGHACVAKALIEACPDAVELLDVRGRTFLHAAARGGHSKVVSLAIAMKEPTTCRLLNTQDGDGNTPLHLAVAALAPDVAEALLRNGKVQADVMNTDGHTPLDLAAKSTSFFSMLGLVVTLAAFGGQSRPQRRDRVQKWSGQDIAKGIEKTSDSLAVVAVLIATVAFTAANNVPGSYEQSNDQKVLKGMAVLQHEDPFKCFLVLDSFALVTSLIAVVLLVFGKASRSTGSWKTFAVALHCIWMSLISMILAFYAALAAVTTTRAVRSIAYNIIYFALSLLFMVVTILVSPPLKMRTMWKFLWQCGLKGRHSVVRRRIRQQYQVVGAFVPSLFLFMVTNQLAFIGLVIISVR